MMVFLANANRVMRFRRFSALRGKMYSTNYTEEMSQKINRYLYLTSIDIIDRFNGGYRPTLKAVENDVFADGKIPVWVCWWQGLDSAPMVVKKCVESIERNIPKDKAKLIIVTIENYMQYVSFSETIVARYNSGVISLAHLSDILRMQLLYRYGGLWLDATSFVSDGRIREFFQFDFYTVKAGHPTWEGDVHSKGLWCICSMKANKGNALCGFLSECYENYFKARTDILDYFLTDRFIKIAYENIGEVRDMIEKCPINNRYNLELNDRLNEPYEEAAWEKMSSDTYIYKTTYKQELLETTGDNRDTFYKVLLCKSME